MSVSFKPGDLVRIKRTFVFVRCVNIASADWFDFHADQIGLYLHGGERGAWGIVAARVLVGETKCYVDEEDIERLPVNE